MLSLVVVWMLGLFEGSFRWFLHALFGSWKGGTSSSDLPSRASSTTFSHISILSSVLSCARGCYKPFILGDPGAVSRRVGISVGESLL